MPLADQGLAYERAVLAARSDRTLRPLVEGAFLHEDPVEALEAFRRSEHWARVLRLLGESGVSPGARVLDFGGGRGLIATSLALNGFRSTLCEINPSGVCGTGAAEGLRAAVRADFEIVSLPVGELAARGYERFDAAVCRAVLHHLNPLEQTLSELLSALRPGGAFVASDEPTIRQPGDLARLRAEHPFVQFGVDEQAYAPAHYVEVLRAAGFSDVREVFPVSLRDYRRLMSPQAGRVTGTALYLRYRMRSAARPHPGEVRSFVARRPGGAQPAS